MKDKGKYYIKLKFEYGKVTEAGPDVKNDGIITWIDMDYDEVTAFESLVIVPGLNAITQAAADVGKAFAESSVKGK